MISRCALPSVAISCLLHGSTGYQTCSHSIATSRVHVLHRRREADRYDRSVAMRRIEIGFLLDEQWHLMRGEMETSKRPALLALARTLAVAGTPYAIIGGVALQAYRAEPRTTLDVDLAVAGLDALPRDALRAAGFEFSSHFAHPEN